MEKDKEFKHLTMGIAVKLTTMHPFLGHSAAVRNYFIKN